MQGPGAEQRLRERKKQFCEFSLFLSLFFPYFRNLRNKYLYFLSLTKYPDQPHRNLFHILKRGGGSSVL